MICNVSTTYVCAAGTNGVWNTKNFLNTYLNNHCSSYYGCRWIEKILFMNIIQQQKTKNGLCVRLPFWVTLKFNKQVQGWENYLRIVPSTTVWISKEESRHSIYLNTWFSFTKASDKDQLANSLRLTCPISTQI